MKEQHFTPTTPDFIGADAALKRAARRALETALQLGTPCWVMDGDQIVDLTLRYLPNGELRIDSERPPTGKTP